ncbi:MAG: phosphate propanoyltransferase [Eubacteriaceae bacterium]
MQKLVPIAMSNRHIHLSQEDLEMLFGTSYELTHFKDLSQPGQFACEEKVDIIGSKGALKGVRILGPVRNKTQIEISVSDGFVLGVKAPIRDSGHLDDSPGVKIVGPNGEVILKNGVVVAARHIHMNFEEASKYSLKDKEIVSVLVKGKRGLVFNNVLVRTNENYSLEMHVDVEEGNAAGVKNGQLVEIV